MRAFVGIPLAADLVTTLVAARVAVMDADPRWRSEKWVAPENLHLTLRFLGDIDPADVSACETRVARGCSSINPFALTLDSARAIPRRGAASLLWIETGEGTAEMTHLAAAIEDSLQGLLPPELRHFRSHVTLCRARRPRPLAAEALAAIDASLSAADNRTMSVLHATLFASHLGPSGPHYEPLAVFNLGD